MYIKTLGVGKDRVVCQMESILCTEALNAWGEGRFDFPSSSSAVRLILRTMMKSLQKASELDCRSKIEFRERKEGTDPCAEVSQWPLDRKIPKPREQN